MLSLLKLRVSFTSLVDELKVEAGSAQMLHQTGASPLRVLAPLGMKDGQFFDTCT